MGSFDWNVDGKHDWQDDFIDYKLSSSNSHQVKPTHGRRPSGNTELPTWVIVLAVIGILSGSVPINGFTLILAIVFIIMLVVRLLK